MLIFSNPGEIDPRLITTLGVNVKAEGSSPIGFFGTGLKYGLAAGLRLGLRVEIWSGLCQYNFEARTETIRGKEFGLVYMNDQALGFTTELGKQWELWQVYREFWCNTKDEGGEVSQFPDHTPQPGPMRGYTSIMIYGLDETHASRKDFILSTEPKAFRRDIELHPGSQGRVFYRGVLVFTFPKQSLFHYNILAPMILTEDRTMKDYYSFRQILAKAILAMEQEEIILQYLLTSDQFHEHDLDMDWASVKPSEAFLAASEQMYHLHPGKMNQSARSVLLRSKPGLSIPSPMQMTKVETIMLTRAKEFLARLGHPIDEPINLVENLPGGAFGCVRAGQVYISRHTFNKGTKWLAGTLLEEHIHMTEGYYDCTRELQNWLFDRIVSLGEEMQGEPL